MRKIFLIRSLELTKKTNHKFFKIVHGALLDLLLIIRYILLIITFDLLKNLWISYKIF